MSLQFVLYIFVIHYHYPTNYKKNITYSENVVLAERANLPTSTFHPKDIVWTNCTNLSIQKVNY